MAAADQIKSLIHSFGKSDESRFFATAMQIAAAEARSGHATFARELIEAIDKAKQERSVGYLDKNNIIPISKPNRDLDDLIEVYHPKIKLVDMVLAPHIEETLKRIVAEQRKFEQLKKFNLSPRRKLLLEGPPGCGKTMTAQALAGELGLNVFIVRLDGLISKFMGESIAKLRLIFEAMQEYRAVYLFDEFDSIGTNRSHPNDVGEIRRVLNSFLINIEKDESNSLLIAATNLPESLDKALYRRFDDIVQYPLPTGTEIKAIIQKTLKGFARTNELTLQTLVKNAIGLSFADIIRACEEAIKEMIIHDVEKVSEKTINQFFLARKRSND